MQAQRYSQQGQYHTFGEVLYYVPGADNLHVLVGGSIGGW